MVVMAKKIVPILIICALLGIVASLISGLEGKATTNPGEDAIDFELKDVNGNMYKLSDFKGQTVVLNFFATWCQPCIDEAPELEAFAQEYKGAQLLIIAKGESKKRMEKYISETNSKLLYLLDTKEEISKKYGVIGQPDTIIINKEGVIVERFTGPTKKTELIKLIEEKASL